MLSSSKESNMLQLDFTKRTWQLLTGNQNKSAVSLRSMHRNMLTIEWQVLHGEPWRTSLHLSRGLVATMQVMQPYESVYISPMKHTPTYAFSLCTL